MTSYPFIQSLFTNILMNSRAVQGRFYQCVTGFEINSDEMGQVIEETLKPYGKKYPLAMMMPPRSRGGFAYNKAEWERYHFVIFFLKTTYADSNNQVSNRNAATGTSRHTIPQDWHDMKRVAVNFIRVLDRVQRQAGLVNTSFRLDPDEKSIDPVSAIGKDRVSGVKLEFNGSLLSVCELEDYASEDINSIIIPELDSHPEHKL
jgi:hypothetical protein